jgi:hypothetical protein
MNQFQWLSIILSWLFTIVLIYWIFRQENQIDTLNTSIEAQDQVLDFYIRSTTEEPERLIEELNGFMTEHDSAPELLIHFQTLKDYLNHNARISDAADAEKQIDDETLSSLQALNSNPQSLQDLDEIFSSMLSKNFQLIDSMQKYSDKTVDQEIWTEATKALEEASIQISKTTNSQSWKMANLQNPEGKNYRYAGGVNKEGLPHGFGVATYTNGDIYRGVWENGYQNGSGKWIYTSGDVYDGNYVKGKRNGFGVYTWINGDIYTGYWNDDLKNGKGILTKKKGKHTESGQWKADKLIKSEVLKKEQFPDK